MKPDDGIHTRGEFPDRPLGRRDLAEDPLRQLRAWLDEAERAGEPDPYAMTLATVTEGGTPNARIVSLKRLDERGLVFTSAPSAKTRELGRNPVATLVFHWPRLARQVRVSGEARRTSSAEDAELYEPRPREQRLALRTYPQGSPVPDREALEARLSALQRNEPDPVPRPDDWGGWRVAPATVEFWQGRKWRLHDRFRYAIGDDGVWSITRLAP